MQLTPGDRKILIVTATVFVGVIGVTLLLVHGGATDQDIPSAYSAASGGCKAAFMLLRESGYQVETWERTLSGLPEGRGVTLIIAEPATFPSQEDRQELEAFLKAGGEVIAAGRFAGFYLPLNESAPDPFSGKVWKRMAALSPSPITRAAPEITMAQEGHWRNSSGAVGLYGETDKPVVVEYTIGKGRVIWMAEASPLTNAGLKERGNLEFLMAAVGGPRENRILWDEFVHGYQQSALATKSDRVTGWMALQLGIFAVAILLAYSRRSGPIWNPEGEARLSPLEFVRTLGSLYEHAGAANVAVEISYQRFRYLLTRRLGLSVNSSISDIENAVRERGELQRENIADTLSECESCRYDAGVSASTALRLSQALFDYAVGLKLIRSKQGERKAWKQS